MTRQILFTSVLLLSLSACEGDDSAPEAAPPADSQAEEAPAPPPPSPSDAPIGPISSRGEVVPGGGGAAGQGAGIDFDLPANWQSEQPSSNMRMAQASIPGSGSAGPGDLVVFYFGPGGGGGVEANIERWIGQMEVAPGTQPSQESFDANGYRVTLVDVKGTLLPSTMGTGPATPQPNYRLMGAVVEGPGGPWFFKATGPEATIAAERDAFVSMLRSVRGQ
jgi:hypothetical protein